MVHAQRFDMAFFFESVKNIYRTVTDPFFGKKSDRPNKRKRSVDDEDDSKVSKENVDFEEGRPPRKKVRRRSGIRPPPRPQRQVSGRAERKVSFAESTDGLTGEGGQPSAPPTAEGDPRKVLELATDPPERLERTDVADGGRDEANAAGQSDHAEEPNAPPGQPEKPAATPVVKESGSKPKVVQRSFKSPEATFGLWTKKLVSEQSSSARREEYNKYEFIDRRKAEVRRRRMYDDQMYLQHNHNMRAEGYAQTPLYLQVPGHVPSDIYPVQHGYYPTGQPHLFRDGQGASVQDGYDPSYFAYANYIGQGSPSATVLHSPVEPGFEMRPEQALLFPAVSEQPSREFGNIVSPLLPKVQHFSPDKGRAPPEQELFPADTEDQWISSPTAPQQKTQEWNQNIQQYRRARESIMNLRRIVKAHRARKEPVPQFPREAHADPHTAGEDTLSRKLGASTSFPQPNIFAFASKSPEPVEKNTGTTTSTISYGDFSRDFEHSEGVAGVIDGSIGRMDPDSIISGAYERAKEAKNRQPREQVEEEVVPPPPKAVDPGIPAGELLIPPADEARLDLAWNRQLDDSEIVVEDGLHGNKVKMDRDITRQAFQVLHENEWLGDIIINAYLKVLNNITGRPNSLNVHWWNTYFFAKLYKNEQCNYSSVKRWIRKVKGRNIFDKDLMLVPVHQNENHWVLIVADMKAKTIKFYDSMVDIFSGRGNPRWEPYSKDAFSKMQCVAEYMDELAKAKEIAPPPRAKDTWDLSIPTRGVPQQKNGIDCGVFMLQTGRALQLGRELSSYGQNHIAYYRKLMGATLLNPQRYAPESLLLEE